MKNLQGSSTKLCSKENYLQSLKYPLIRRGMFSRTLKVVERTQHIGEKNKSFPAGERARCRRPQGAIQRLACQFQVGQRLETAWGHFKIYIEIKSKMLPALGKVTNVTFHPSFLDSVFSPQGDACKCALSENCLKLYTNGLKP